MHHEIIQALSDTHRNMERVLMLMRFQIDALREGDQPAAFQLLRNAVGYMHHYPGLVHHPVEELIFAKLIHYAPETSVVCARLSEQHKLFAQWEAQLSKHIRAAQGSPDGAWRQIKEIGIPYCVEHASHIHGEETEVLPHAGKHLKPADWREIDGRSKAMVDPIFGSDGLKRYDNLYDYLMSADHNFDVH